MSLFIVIINYRTPQVTIDCLASLASQIDDVPGASVALIDNASGDDSVPRLQEAIARNGWERWVHLIASDTNTGFAGGNNLGIAAMPRLCPDARSVLLLNSDTIALPGVLKFAAGKMDADATIGVMSCLLLNKDLTVQNTARKLATPLRLAAYSFGLPWAFPRAFSWANLDDPGWDRRAEARDVDWVGGAFMMIRREVLDRIGGLDQRFFFYGEDAEYCHRVRKNGWRVRYEPGAAIVHLGGASSDPTRVATKQKNKLMWEARYLMQRICHGRLAEAFIRGVDILSFGLRYLKLVLRGRRHTPEFATQRDVLAILLRTPRAAAGGKG